MGEMERLKEFSIKSSKEELDKAGGDLNKLKGVDGKTIKEKFGGGAEKLAQSSGGKWSTVVGNVKSGIQDSGRQMLDKLAPSLAKLVPISEKIGQKLPGVIDGIIKKASEIWDKISPGVKILADGFIKLWQKTEPFRNMLGRLAEKVLPIVSDVFQALGKFIGDVLPPILNAFGWIIENTVSPFLDDMGRILNTYVIPAIDGVGKALNWLSDGIKSAVDFIKGIADGVSGLSETANQYDNMGNHRSSGSSSGESGGGTRGQAEGFSVGLQRVPHDDFIARLHKDEAVIPAKSNPYNPSHSRLSGSNKKEVINNITINIDGGNKNNDDIVDEMVSKLKLALDNM